MSEMQLQLPLDDTDTDNKLAGMQSQIDAIAVSSGKVRRRMFAELGELKKLCQLLAIENEMLKDMLREKKHKHIEWTYGDGDLFKFKEA